jgi:hypothetical protein
MPVSRTTTSTRNLDAEIVLVVRGTARGTRQIELHDRQAREHRGYQQERNQHHHQVQERGDVDFVGCALRAPLVMVLPGHVV